MNKRAKELTKAMLSFIVSLLLSGKNTFIEYQTKLFPFARAFLGFCLAGLLLVSCASGPKRAGNIWWADSTSKVNNEWLSFGISTIDDQDVLQYWINDPIGKQYGYQIPPGQHTIAVSSKWSNQFRDETRLTLDVKEGRKYVVYAYELEQGQDPKTPVVLPRDNQESTGGKILKDIGVVALETLGYSALLVAGPYVVVYGSPIWVPYVAYTHYQQKKKLKEDAGGLQGAEINVEAQPADNVAGEKTQPPDYAEVQPVDAPLVPKARPFDGCCYVWVEDSETREVVAGTRLPGAGK